MSRKQYRAIADYYDLENVHHRMLREDVPFFMGQLPRKKQDILELAVGTGRAAIPLAQAGHRVVGVDYASDMLALARQKRDAVGLNEKQLELVKADLLGLDLGRTFDWICLFFNTFLAFTMVREQDAVLQRVHRHLKPQGRFWLDIFQPDLGRLAIARQSQIEPYVFFVPRFNRTVMKTTEMRQCKAPQVRQITFHYTWCDAHGREHRQRTVFDMTYIFPRELQLLLERNGLEIEHLFGNYDGSELTSASPRIIARCCRR